MALAQRALAAALNLALAAALKRFFFAALAGRALVAPRLYLAHLALAAAAIRARPAADMRRFRGFPPLGCGRRADPSAAHGRELRLQAFNLFHDFNGSFQLSHRKVFDI